MCHAKQSDLYPVSSGESKENLKQGSSKVKFAFYKGSGQGCGECNDTTTKKLARRLYQSKMLLATSNRIPCGLNKRRFIFFSHSEKYDGRWLWALFRAKAQEFSLPSFCSCKMVAPVTNLAFKG